MNHKKELLRSLWVGRASGRHPPLPLGFQLRLLPCGCDDWVTTTTKFVVPLQSQKGYEHETSNSRSSGCRALLSGIHEVEAVAVSVRVQLSQEIPCMRICMRVNRSHRSGYVNLARGEVELETEREKERERERDVCMYI